MGLLDSFEDPLAETGELLSDLGVTGAEDEINKQTRAIQAAIDQFGGVPAATARCLFGVDWSKQPSAALDAEDLSTQGGQVLDNALAPLTNQNRFWPLRGIGMLTAGALSQNVFQDSTPQRPIVLVQQVNVEEGLGQVWSAELELALPVRVPLAADGTPLPWDQFLQQASNPDKTAGAISGVVTDAVNYASTLGASKTPDPSEILGGIVEDAEEYWLDKVGDPVGNTALLSAAVDPDAIDPADPRRERPLRHDAPFSLIAPPASAADDQWGLQALLGTTCRVSISRRFPQNKYTLSERWFTGIVTEVEERTVPDGAPLRLFRVRVQPRLSLLAHRKRYRAFHSTEGSEEGALNAVTIVQKILEEHGVYTTDAADASDANRDEHAVRYEPGGFELFGPLAVPDAAVGALDSIATAVGSISGDAGAALGSVADALKQSLAGWRPTREYTVQYGETDLEFVERLLAEEGLTYYFEHDERRETLVIAEDPRIAGTKVLTAARTPLLGFLDKPPVTADRNEYAWDCGVSRGLSPAGVTLRDRHYTRPYHPTDLKAGSAIDGFPGSLSDVFTLGGLEQLANQAMAAGAEMSGATGTEDYAGPHVQQYQYPARLAYPPGDDPHGHYSAFDGPPYGEVELQRLRSRAVVLRAKSNCAMMLPGNNVRLERAGFDIMQLDTSRAQRLLVTKVRHTASAFGQGGDYANEFEATHMGVAHRPPAPPRRPRIGGVQSATVVDVETLDDHPRGELSRGQDAFFRVRVRFRWDRGTPDGGAPRSPWLRFAMPSAGANTGTLTAPRVGTEVLVSFEDGNPDRPLIVGAVYNAPPDAGGYWNTYHPLRAANLSPDRSRMDAETRLVQSGLLSRTFSEDTTQSMPEGHRLWFHDAPDDRLGVHLESVGHLVEVVGEDLVTSVRDSAHHTVEKGSQTETVGGDQTLRLRLSMDEETKALGRLKHVEKGDEQVVIGEGDEPDEPDREDPEDEDVAFPPFGRRDHHVIGNDKRSVAGSRTHTIGGFEVLRVKGATDGGDEAPARKLRVKGDHTVTITGDDTFEVWGDRRVKVAKAHEVTAKKVDLQTPASAPLPGEDDSTEEAEGGLTLDEDGARLSSTGQIVVRAQEELTIESTGDRVCVRAPKKIWLQGASHAVVLDAENERIELVGAQGSEVTFACGAMELVVKDGAIRLMAGGDELAQLSVTGGVAELRMTGSAGLVMAGDEDIRMASPRVDIQPS